MPILVTESEKKVFGEKEYVNAAGANIDETKRQIC
jgi:hypothetical protein